MLAHYGDGLGLRTARKHIGRYLETSGHAQEAVRDWRRRLCTQDDPKAVVAGLRTFYGRALEAAA